MPRLNEEQLLEAALKQLLDTSVPGVSEALTNLVAPKTLPQAELLEKLARAVHARRFKRVRPLQLPTSQVRMADGTARNLTEEDMFGLDKGRLSRLPDRLEEVARRVEKVNRSLQFRGAFAYPPMSDLPGWMRGYAGLLRLLCADFEDAGSFSIAADENELLLRAVEAAHSEPRYSEVVKLLEAAARGWAGIEEPDYAEDTLRKQHDRFPADWQPVSFCDLTSQSALSLLLDPDPTLANR